MEQHRLAIATISLGWHESHSLSDKLKAASKYGYRGVEMVYSDLERDATLHARSVTDHATHVRIFCDKLNLSIVTLAAFENYEGSPEPLAQRLGKAHEWVTIARLLGTEIIQIPATFDHASLAASEDEIVNELRMLADCGASREGIIEPAIVFAYEPLPWSARTTTWQHALYIKRRVARPNFKLCLDTYHIHAKLWGDCTTSDGRIPGGEAALEASLHESLRELHPDDISFLQLSDAERHDPPISLAELRRMKKHYAQYWCMWGRLFPLETEYGAYLPMVDICRAWLVELGWTGWVSMETFHRHMADEERRPEEWARRGAESWKRLKAAIEASQTKSNSLHKL